MTIEENTIPNPEKWTLNERFFDWHCIEAICPHGIGHHRGVHGCDGCCTYCPPEMWEKTTQDKDEDEQ